MILDNNIITNNKEKVISNLTFIQTNKVMIVNFNRQLNFSDIYLIFSDIINKIELGVYPLQIILDFRKSELKLEIEELYELQNLVVENIIKNEKIKLSTIIIDPMITAYFFIIQREFFNLGYYGSFNIFSTEEASLKWYNNE